MTFSISARCERSGELGVAVTTAWFAVGSVCPAVRVNIGAVASQALVNANLRAACLDQLAAGVSPERALAEALRTDAAPEQRQVSLIDAAGGPAAPTGEACPAACRPRIARDGGMTGNTTPASPGVAATEAPRPATMK